MRYLKALIVVTTTYPKTFYRPFSDRQNNINPQVIKLMFQSSLEQIYKASFGEMQENTWLRSAASLRSIANDVFIAAAIPIVAITSSRVTFC